MCLGFLSCYNVAWASLFSCSTLSGFFFRYTLLPPMPSQSIITVVVIFFKQSKRTLESLDYWFLIFMICKVFLLFISVSSGMQLTIKIIIIIMPQLSDSPEGCSELVLSYNNKWKMWLASFLCPLQQIKRREVPLKKLTVKGKVTTTPPWQALRKLCQPMTWLIWLQWIQMQRQCLLPWGHLWSHLLLLPLFQGVTKETWSSSHHRGQSLYSNYPLKMLRKERLATGGHNNSIQ